jgi:hypothetical protein
MTKQEAIQNQIDEVMDTFQFENVHRWMEHSGWSWGQPNSNESSVPDLFEIKRCARQRLKTAAKTGYSSTGGFTAERSEGADENGPWIKLTLYFGYQTANDGTTYKE